MAQPASSPTMGDKESTIYEHFEAEEQEDTLSFCNFQMGENASDSVQDSPRNSTAQIDQLFDFFTGTSSKPYSNPDIILFGKIMRDKEDDEENELNEYQKRDYFMVKSPSFRKPPMHVETRTLKRSISNQISNSPRISGDLDYHAQRVNITSLTSMSSKSRRRMFMFGPVKFKPEMELSAIKQRQSKKPPVNMSRTTETAVSGGAKSRWGLVRSMRGRSHLANLLARSFGCIPLASGVERLIRVNN